MTTPRAARLGDKVLLSIGNGFTVEATISARYPDGSVEVTTDRPYTLGIKGGGSTTTNKFRAEATIIFRPVSS